MNMRQRYRQAKIGDEFIIPRSRAVAERHAANQIGWSCKIKHLDADRSKITIAGNVGAPVPETMIDVFRQAVIGDEFIVPRDRRATVTTTLNKAGWSVRTSVNEAGEWVLRIIGEKQDDKESIIRKLKQLDLRQLKAVVAACKQAKLIP
jgi:hypothetical protein